MAFLSDELVFETAAPMIGEFIRFNATNDDITVLELNVPANALYFWSAISNSGGDNQFLPKDIIYVTNNRTFKNIVSEYIPEIQNTISVHTSTLNELQSQIDDLTDSQQNTQLQERSYYNNGIIYNYNLTDSTQYANLIGYAESNITTNGYTPAAGWSNKIKIDKYIVSDDISINYEISIVGTPVIAVGTNDAGFTNSKHSSIVKIDFTNNTLSFLGNANIDGNTLPTAVYESYTLENISGTEYRIEIGKTRRCPYVTMTNLTTNSICCHKILDIYATSAGYGGKAGAMYDFPTFGVISGTCYYKRVMARVQPNYDVVFIGDSITEGSQVSFDDTWTNKLINSEYISSGLNCGRGGGNINHALRCVKDICSILSPKYVVVTIGTNGGNTLANLNELRTEILNIGALPIINCIPMTSDGYPVANDTILKIDTLHCRFDIATAINNNTSQGQDSSLFATDKTHPNVTGGQKMYDCFVATVGSLIKL